MGQQGIKSKPRPEQITPILDIAGLRKSVQGPVYTPEDIGYDESRAAWNWDATGFPSAIVTVSGIPDIQAVVSFARKHNLDLCIAGGRHSHLCMINNSLVLDMSKMKQIDFDAETQQVRVQAGVKLGQLDAELERYGCIVPAGHNPDTGVAGLTLGGGVGWAVRRYGLTVDSLLQLRLVTAEGEYITADKDNHPDLYWALRGGGGNFGVVVDFLFKTSPMPSKVLGGAIVFPNLPEFVHALQLTTSPMIAAKKVRDYWVNMPHEVGSMLVMPMGGPLVTLWTYVGPEEAGRKEFEKFEFSSPINTIKLMSYQTGVQKLAEDEQPSGNYWEKGCLINELTDELLDLIWKFAHEQPSEVTGAFVLVALGGKMAEVSIEETAFEQRNGKHWLLMLGKWDEPQHKQIVVDYIRKAHKAISPHSEGSYAPVINVPEGEDWETDNGAAVFSKNAERLVSVKQKYDPTNLFHMNRNINLKK